MDQKWEIRRILTSRKIRYKSGRLSHQEYLVDWAPSWVGEKEINPDLITDTKYTISVLGPEKCKSNDDCNGDITKMDIVVQKIPRPEYPDLETVLVLMPYEVVREQYTAQLFRYYEQITFLPSEEEH